ncbi:unnamed protein product, partial [marine sediment metagenome]
MQELSNPFRFMLYMLGQALRHPRTPIQYQYCPACKLRFNEPECP